MNHKFTRQLDNDHPMRDSNPKASDLRSDALSIRPMGPAKLTQYRMCYANENDVDPKFTHQLDNDHPTRDSTPQSSDQRFDALSIRPMGPERDTGI